MKQGVLDSTSEAIVLSGISGQGWRGETRFHHRENQMKQSGGAGTFPRPDWGTSKL